MLNELEIKAERLKAGRTDQFDEHGKRPLAEHVEAFGRSLEAKGGTVAHVADTLAKLRTIFAGCDFHRLTDLSAARVGDFLASARQNGLPAAPLAEPTAATAKGYAAIARAFGVGVASVKWWRRQGAPIQPRGACDLAAIHRWRTERAHVPMSIATSNHYLTAAKGIRAAWLVRDRRWPENPLAHLSALNAEVDLRRERRALSADEFGRLVEAARVGATFRGMSGPGSVQPCSTPWRPTLAYVPRSWPVCRPKVSTWTRTRRQSPSRRVTRNTGGATCCRCAAI